MGNEGRENSKGWGLVKRGLLGQWYWSPGGLKSTGDWGRGGVSWKEQRGSCKDGVHAPEMPQASGKQWGPALLCHFCSENQAERSYLQEQAIIYLENRSALGATSGRMSSCLRC